MKLSITDKNKKELFVAIFHILKNCTNIISVIFKKDHFYIQGMDKSHICLFDVVIYKSWFKEYEINDNDSEKVCFDTHTFYNIIASKQDSHIINVHYDGYPDNFHIDLLAQENSKGDFDKFFKIPLADFDYDIMNIPTTEYEAEFSISAKKICDITYQMMIFGTDINIKCSEEKIDLVTNGIAGEMLVNVSIEDLTEYSILEGGIIDLKYSLNYVQKMCLTNKLSTEIDFCVSEKAPMKIKYDLGDNSSVIFYIAPKIDD